MNEQHEQYRTFKNNLREATASGFTARFAPRRGNHVWVVSPSDNKEIEVELTYTNYPHNGGPAVYITNGSTTDQTKLTNLSAANLAKHIAKRVEARRQQLAEYAEEDAKEDAAEKARKRMVEFISVDLHAFKHGMSDMDVYDRWSAERGYVQLTDVEVLGKPGQFSLVYHFEYDLKTGPGREIHLRGEFSAVTSAQILRTIHALIAID